MCARQEMERKIQAEVEFLKDFSLNIKKMIRGIRVANSLPSMLKRYWKLRYFPHSTRLGLTKPFVYGASAWLWGVFAGASNKTGVADLALSVLPLKRLLL